MGNDRFSPSSGIQIHPAQPQHSIPSPPHLEDQFMEAHLRRFVFTEEAAGIFFPGKERSL
jgi:hypothetical protein